MGWNPVVTEADVVCLIIFIIVLCGQPPLGMFTCTVKPGVEVRKPSRRRVCPLGGQEAGRGAGASPEWPGSGGWTPACRRPRAAPG